MTELFLRVLEMSATASIVIGAVMLLRPLLRKAPKVFSYVLWAAALFRLLCPVSFELPAAPIPSVELPYIEGALERSAEGLFITYTDTENIILPEYSEPQNEQPEQVTAMAESEPAAVMGTPVKKQINLIVLASYIWALAVCAMVFRGIISWVRLSRTLRSAQKMGENVYVSPAISDAFLMGIIRPKIFLPTGLSCKESDLIIRHERTHMHRGDHIAKLVMYAALCIHCFNPLVWVMFRLFERDMEMSCDERVTADMTKEQKADHSETLLKISSKPATAFTACFGESSTKQRVKNVLSFKKPGVWVIIVLTVSAVVVSVFLCADKNKNDSLASDSTQSETAVSGDTRTVTVPNVNMLDQSTAITMLNGAGLNVSVVFQQSEAEANTVIHTIPEGGTETEQDSNVIIYVSSGSGNSEINDGISSDLIPALGKNNIHGYMKQEDMMPDVWDKYENYRMDITDKEELEGLYKEYFKEYGENVYSYTFYRECADIPLYDESGESIVDHFQIKSNAIPVIPKDDEYYDWKDTIRLVPLTEERQRTADMSSAPPEMLYADKRNCLFIDGLGGLYLYNFENRELLLAADFLGSMELVNSEIADEEKQYGGASIYSRMTGGKEKNIYLAFETKGKEKRGGAFNGRYYYLDVINSRLSMVGGPNSLNEAAVTNQINPTEQPDALSSLLAMMNKRDHVYIVKGGIEGIRLARNINGNVEYFDPFENGLIPDSKTAPEEWGLSFTAEKPNAEGVTVKLSRNGGRELATGSYFIIQKKDIYGWSEPSHCAEYFMSEHVWTTEALTIPSDGEMTLYEDWSGIYGELSPGSYRIGKYFSVGKEEEQLLYAYFTV